MADFFLREDFAGGELAGEGGADGLLEWARGEAAAVDPGDVYRHREGRTTLRLRRNGRGWFLKLHRGVGWREILKNLCSGRAPVTGAINEFRAVQALENIGVDTLSLAAYASRGRSPATRQSMLVSEELTGTVSLEDYCARWRLSPPSPAVRTRIIRKLADVGRRMHGAGINHRDFYLCHFHLDESSLTEPLPRCYLIDLHRAGLRHRMPLRWRIKDLAGLYFSAMDCGLTRRDLLRFMRHYSAGGLRQALGEDARMWARVERRARRLYHKGIPGGPRCAQLRELLGSPLPEAGQWMARHTRVLKDDTYTTAGLLRVDGENCFLKFYRARSPLQRAQFALGGGRPTRSYAAARALRARGVAVPCPLACLRVPGGALVLTEGIEGPGNLAQLWRQQAPGAPEARSMMVAAGETLAQLHRAGWAHGDCKWHNLFWDGRRVHLLDLDGARRSRAGGPGQARDVARFTLSAEELSVGKPLYDRFLDSYLKGTGDTGREAVARLEPFLQKLRARHLARYGPRGQRLW